MSKIKVAIILDSDRVNKYALDFITWCTDNENICFENILFSVNSDQSNNKNRVITLIKKRGLKHFIRLLAHLFLLKFESIILFFTNKKVNHFGKFNISEFDLKIHKIYELPSNLGIISRYTEDSIKLIKSLDLDLIIRMGGGIIKGEILNSSKFGILSLHHGDNRINRGGPAGFWEVFQRKPKSGFIVQRLTNDLDGGDIIFRGEILTRQTFLLNQIALFEKSFFYLKKCINDLILSGELNVKVEFKIYSNIIYKIPSLRITSIYIFHTFIRLINLLFLRLFPICSKKWNVSFINSDWTNALLYKSITLDVKKGQFIADPFLFEHEGKTYCFVEEYDFKLKKAAIAVYELEKKSFIYLGKVLEENFHLSFPFVFSYENKIYMIPETCSDKSIRLYECLKFPFEWKLKTILMNNVLACDSIVHYYNNKWWLFTNMDSTNSGDYNSELFIFYCDDLFNPEWRPHAMNPIYCDPSISRNGGILFNKSKIYRVRQNHLFLKYGSNISIAEIVVLNENEFEEKFCIMLDAEFVKGDGLHHLHSNNNYTVVDYFS